MTISFDPPDETDGLDVRDAIERRQYALRTDRPVAPTPADADRFTFPVSEAVAVRAGEVVLPSIVATYVRTTDGEMVAEAGHYSDQQLPPGSYSIELCAPIKLYLRVEGPLSISADGDRMVLSFDGEREVVVGARSHHERPAGTITTTPDPTDVMVAVSHLGSALKTTSPERSFPTLRGHPPTIELGEELAVPGHLSVPDTGVRIELPPELGHVYVAAPLAYYLGAEVVPGSQPRIVTDEGFVYPLSETTGPTAGRSASRSGFETAVERALKQTFVLDCVTRTEGLYQVDLQERRTVERSVDLDFAALYDRSLSERLESYLSVPYDAVADQVPEWKLTTHLAPAPENVEMLPFAVDDLAVVRTPRATPAEVPETAVEAVDDFVRRSAGASENAPSLVEPEAAESMEQAWVGDDAPLGASKATTEAFRNKLRRGEAHGDADIAVVCNDPKMAEEHVVAGEVYGSRDELPFDVELHSRLTVAELRRLLESDADFLHYVGHIDEEGFECTDGKLDARELDDVGVDAFLLNACTSYEQGMALVEAGAIGGVVTVADVIDSGAVELGKTMARLLNRGFPLRAALSIAKEENVIGDQYVLVGTGNLEIAQPESGSAVRLDVESTGDGYAVTHYAYPSSYAGIGALITHTGSDGRQYLNSGAIETSEMTASELRELLSRENRPVTFDGELAWSQDLQSRLD